MRTLVILLSSFLFHWEAVSRGIPSETPRQGGEGEERLGIAGEERILDEVGGGGTSLVDDGRQKSRPTRDGLTRREIGSVEEAWSGTDWGGSHLPRFAEDRQELDRKERNLSPLISLLESNLKETELKKHRDRRSLISDTHGDEEIRKILMNAREKLSDLKSRNTIDDDWIFFVLPSRSGTLTESLFRPAGNGFKIGAQSWRQNEKWLDDKEFLNANKFDYNERNLKKYEESPLSDWNIDGRNKYSGEPAEISWTGEGRSDEKNGGTNFALTKGGRNRSNKQRLIKNDAHRNGDEDYRGIKVNVDVKNGETYGDISIDNTMGNVVGSDKLSAAEISVKIPEARYNKAIRNKRPSSDNKSRFVSDPFVFLTEFEGGTRREEKNKGSTPRESNVIKVHQSPPGGKLIEKKVEEKPYRDSKYSFPIIVGKHLDAKFSNDESRTNKNGGERARMDDELSWIEKEEAKLKQGEKNSGELQVLQLLKELSNIREQIERNQNLYGGNERNHGSSPSRVERIDARNGIRVEYDKQKSAAETSIPLDVNKRGGVKHGERVEEKSTSKIDENVDGERKKEKKGVHRDELQKETVKKRDDYDSDENVKWTSLKGKQKVIDDVNKDKDKLEKKTFEKGNSEVRKSQQIGINNKTNLSKIKFNVENLEEKDNHERKKQDSKIENENFQEKLKEKFDTENLKKIIFGVKIPKIKGIEDSNINSEDFRLENLNWIEYKGENLDTEDNEGNLRKENEIRKNIDNNINGQKYGSNNLKEGKRKKFKIQEQRGQNILVDTKKEYKSDDIKDEKISAKKEEREKYDNTKVKETGIGIKTPQDEKLNTEPLKNKGLEINIPKIEVNDVKKDDNTLLLDKPKWADINADNLETKKIEDTVEKDKWNGIDKLKNNIEVHNGKKYELDDTKDEKISAKEDEKYDDSRVKETSTAIKTPQGEELKTENLKNKGLEINTPKIEVNDVKKDDNKLLIDKPRWTDINADNLKTTKIEDTTVKDNWKGIDDLKNVEIDNGKKYKLNDIKKEKLNAKKEDKEKYDNTKVKDIGIENKIPQDEKFKTETLKNKGLEINIPKTEVKDVKKDDNKLLIDKPQWTDINADNLKTAKIEDTVEKDKWKGIDELKKNVEVDNGKKYELDNTKAEKISAKEEEKYDNSKVKETSTAIKTPQDEELKTETLKNKGLEINTPKIEVKDNNKFLLEKPKWADISLDNLKTTKIEDSIEKDQWKEIDELKKNTIVDNGKKFELDNTKNKKISAKEDEKYDNSKVKETSTEIKNPQDEKLNIENLKNKRLEINIPKIEVEDVKKDDNKLLIDKPQWTDINADNLKTAKIEDTVEKDKWKGIDELKKNVEVDNAKELGVTEDEKINKEEEKKYDNSKVKETSIEIKTPQDEKLKTETLKNKGLEINTPKIEVNDVKKDDNTLLLDKPKWADINADNLKTAKIEDTVEKDKWKGIDELKKNVEVDNAKESGVTKDEKINKEEEEKYDNSKVKETSIEIKTPQDEKLKTETLKNKGLEINTPKIEVNDVKKDDNTLLIDKPQWTDINADNLQTTKIGDTIKKDKWKGIDELKKNVEVDNGKKYELDDRKEEKINAKVEEKYDNLRVKETGTAIKTPQDEELKTETLENKGLEIDIPKIEVKDVKKDDSKLLVDKAKWTNINAGNLKTAKIEDIEKDIEKDKWKGIDELEKNTVDENEKKYELDDTRDEKINAKEEQKYDDSRVKETSTAIKTPQDEEHKTETLENKRLEINIPKTEVKDVKKEDSKLLVDKPKWTDINADNLKTAKIEDSVEKDKWKGIDDLKKNVEVDNGKKYELDDTKDKKINAKEEEKYDDSRLKETSTAIKIPQDEELKTETLENKGLEINIPKTEVKDIKKDDNKLLVDKPKWTDINADNLKTAKIEDTVEKDGRKWKRIDKLKENVEVDNGKEHELNDIKNEKGENKEKFDNSKVKETSIAIKTPQDQKFGTENLKNKKLDIVHSRIDKFGDINVDNIKFQKGKWTDYNVDNLNWKESNSLEKYEWKELINRIDELIRDIEVYNAKKYNLNNINDKKIGTLNRSKEKYDISNIKDTSIETKIPKEQKIPIKRLEEDKYKIINPEIVKLGDIKIDDNKFQVGKWTDYNIDNLKLKENNNKEILEENKWKRFNDLRKKNTEIENKKKNKSNDIRDEKISTTNKDIERYDSKNSKVKETDVEAKTPHEKKLDREEYVKENKLKADDVFRPKLKNVVEKESKMKDNNGKEYISNTDNEKLEDENTSEKEFQLQKLNKGNKLKSKDLKEEKNDRKISVEEDLETKKSKIEDTKKDKFSLQNKIGKVIQENDKFKAEDLKVKEIGLKNSREEYILKDKESGSVNLKNGKNQLLVIEKFKPHLDNNVLWTSKKNDKNSVQSVVNDSKKKDIISYNDKISLKERNESSEKDKKIDDEYEKGTKKYGINENFDSSVNIRNDKNLKKDFWNKDTAYKKEDLYVTRDNALENSNKRNKSGKQDYEVISYKKPLNENEEHEIFENKSRNNNEKLISNEEEVIYKDGNADKISQYENKLKEDLKIEENDENRIKQTGPSFVKEEINETGNIRKKGNEKFDKEILKSSEVENDSLKNDDKKDLKLERTFDKNTLTTEENNVLIRGEELQTVPILSEKTKIAKKEDTFGNAETNKKDSVLLSEKTKLEDKKSLNEFEIHEDKNKELENNDVDVARATEFNKLSKYKNNDTIKTANIGSNRVSNDIVVNSRQTDSADEINKKLGKNGKESSTIQFENLNRTMDSLDITIAGEGNLRNSKGNEELSTVAHVAKLDENKALRSSEDDTSEVETSTGIKSNSDTSAIVNRTADKGQIEIRGSSVNLSELSDIDVHPPEHSDTLGKKDNPSLVSRTVSVDDNEIGGNKIPRYEGSPNVDTRKESEESEKETESTKKESENVLLLNDSKKNGEESKKEKKIGIQSVKESPLKAQETASNLSKESDFEKVRGIDNKFDAKPTDSTIDIQTDTKDVKKVDDKLYTSREEEANSENIREKYHTKPRILESSELNSNILPKILIGNRRKEPDLVEKLKTTSNDDVNLKQTTVSSSTRGSKFPDNNGASRERNISSNAINQAAEEELEKKKITWRNAAVDHPSEENDSKMINLSFTNIDKNEMREAKKGGTSSVITDEKSRTDDTRTTFSNVVDLIEKNSKELENYNNDRSINKIDKYGTNDSRDRFEEIGSKIDSSSLRDLKQERVTRKDKLNDSKNVEKIEEEGVRNESESITGDLNKKEVFKEGSDGGIQVTESNDVTGESEDSSSAPKDEVSLSDLSVESFGKNDKLEKKQRGTLDLSIKDEGKSEDEDEIIGSSGMRGSNKYKTPSTTRQLIEDNELEQFLPTSIQTALNTKTTSQVYPSDVDENPITSRLPEDVTAHAFNWADNERYKELPNKVVAPIPEKIRDNTQIYDSSASRSPKLETGNKLSKLGKQTDEKIENAKENDEKGEKIDASNVTKLENGKEEKVKSKNILNEYNDKNNKNVINEIGSLKESKISDIENNKREEKKSLNENDKLKVQEKNENIEINNKDLTNNYDENLKSKILTDVNVAEDNLLKNDKSIGHKDIPEKEEKNSVLKLLLNEEKIKGSEDKVKKLLIDDNNNNDKRDESIGTRIKIIPEKLNKKQNKETFKTKLNGESKNYEDKLLSAKYRIAKPNENLDEILDDERETQIQKTLTESEIAITELPLLKQNKEENIIEEKEKTNFKVEEERTPNENQPYKTIYNTDNETIENQKGYNIVSNQLNSTASDLNLKNKNEILKEHEIQDKFNSNIARNILIKPYHISTVDKNDFTNSALSDSNKKIYESKIEDQLINDQMNLKKTADSDSSIKSTHISDAIKNGLVLDDSKNTIHESNIKNALNFNVKDDAHNVLIKSTDVPNVAKNKLHDEYKNSILSDSKKIIRGSKAENESKFNIKDNNIFKLDSTSTAINNNLNIKNENSVLNHPKQVNYESNVKDQSKFDLKKDIKSDTSVKSASINDLNTGYNDSKDSKILILKSKIPKLESKLDLKKNIGSDTSVKPIPKLLDQHWTNILFDQPPPTNKIAINNPSKIPSIPSLGNAHFSLDEKERNLKSSGLLSHISQKTPSNEISVEIPNVKFVKKLQPSFWKLAKPQTEIVNKNEQPILVSLSEFKSHPDEKDSDRSMKFSSYTPPSKVSGVESKNDDLYTVLKSLSLFTHFQDDSKDKKVPTTYDDRVSTSEDAPKVGSVERTNDKSSSISQESDREKLDVYIVKQASEGPVKIAHIENTKPLVVTNEEISRSSYEKVVDILEKNGIKTDISTA